MTDPAPTPDEVASLLQVEHLLDQRWPETKLEPSTARISALMELLGSPPEPVVRPVPLVGGSILRLVERLYPICRSITGDGVRETLSILGETVPIEISEVASGTRVLDWTVPPEWNIRDA